MNMGLRHGLGACLGGSALGHGLREIRNIGARVNCTHAFLYWEPERGDSMSLIYL